ncbi:MAG: hypothetical protein KAS63_01130 [Candidatus Heimdallarchaeota archaeon]|nr:hypothetical protein [Candidatus Heimdallarchaeota archaeon]MCK4953946.1 hypothetical protein [Candidatus Heimdallarchaeota archaeon]
MTHETYKIYSRVLKFGQRIGLRRLVESIVFGISVFSITLVYFFVISRPEDSIFSFSPVGKYIFFPLGILAEIVLILSYIENHYHLDIFGENTNRLFGIISVASVIVIVLYSAIPSLYALRVINGRSLSLLVLFFLINVIETGYFLYSLPKVDKTETFGLEFQFSRLEKKLVTKRLNELPIEKAITKGINALKKRVNAEGFWGELNPLYETACVLELFHNMGYNPDTEWTIPTPEGKQTYTLGKTIDSVKAIIETTETIETSFEQFYILYALSLFVPTILDARKQEIEEFHDSIFEETEWDFINKLNRFTPNLRSRTTPLHLIMSYVGDVSGNIKLLDRLSSLFTSTIDIVIKRGYARFSTSQTGKTPIEMFSRLMLILHDIRRAPTKRQQFTQAIGGTQFLEGSWAGNIGTTGYVLQALIPSENADSLLLKKGALYLAAIQDKEGLWAASIEETIIALTALLALKKMAEQEVVG